MRIAVKDLRRLIREGILEEGQHYDEVVLSDGSECAFGDPAHISDMEQIANGLECLRNQQRRGTASRSVFAAAVAQLKSMIRKVASKQESAPPPEPEGGTLPKGTSECPSCGGEGRYGKDGLRCGFCRGKGYVPSLTRHAVGESDAPGKSRKPKPGFGGGAATAPGHGRHSPGD